MTDVATTGNGTLSTEAQALGLTGITKEDLILPRLWMMQPLSSLVTEGRVKPGQIVNSLTNEIVDPEHPTEVEVVPIMPKKVWYKYTIVGNQENFESIFDHGPEHANLKPGPVTEEGVDKFYRRALQFFVVISKDVEKGHAVMPALLTLMKTNYPTGRKLATLLVQSAMLRQPMWGQAYKLVTKQTKNDKGVFFIWEIAGQRKAKDAETQAAAQWENILKSTNYKADPVQDESTVQPTDEEIPF